MGRKKNGQGAQQASGMATIEVPVNSVPDADHSQEQSTSEVGDNNSPANAGEGDLAANGKGRRRKRPAAGVAPLAVPTPVETQPQLVSEIQGDFQALRQDFSGVREQLHAFNKAFQDFGQELGEMKQRCVLVNREIQQTEETLRSLGQSLVRAK